MKSKCILFKNLEMTRWWQNHLTFLAFISSFAKRHCNTCRSYLMLLNKLIHIHVLINHIVSVHWAAITKHHKPGDLQKNQSFLTLLEAGKSENKVPASSSSVRPSFLDLSLLTVPAPGKTEAGRVLQRELDSRQQPTPGLPRTQVKIPVHCKPNINQFCDPGFYIASRILTYTYRSEKFWVQVVISPPYSGLMQRYCGHMWKPFLIR